MRIYWVFGSNASVKLCPILFDFMILSQNASTCSLGHLHLIILAEAFEGGSEKSVKQSGSLVFEWQQIEVVNWQTEVNKVLITNASTNQSGRCVCFLFCMDSKCILVYWSCITLAAETP